jgi:hypothetical protein
MTLHKITEFYTELKIAVFWVVAPCSLVEVYQRFRGPCCLHHQGDRTSNPTYTELFSVYHNITSKISHHRHI